MHPDDLLEQLKKTASPRKQKTLDLIHEVCREQYERGSKDFSVATIARIAADRGGPSKGAIHNATGDDYKGLIKAWAEHTGGVTRKVRQVSENPYNALIDKIENPALRSMMNGILAENRQMRREITLLKAEGNRVIDMRPQFVEPREVVQILPASHGLYATEIEALRHAVSDRFLQDEGWATDAEGRVFNDAKRAIYKPGYVTAIRKIIDVDGEAKQIAGSGDIE
ncbi:MAG: gamma-mobile-trio protein GmtX [Hylemonella sp.]|nr:gamma-mobile-trio protein GmtX [Hylemonella sp.]MDP1936677.1 gamma-mobile-trio protein GmtX [Hylemonella sp.]